MPLPVILDTNFLTVPVQFGVDIFAETERVLERSVEFLVLDSVVDEIKSKLERASRTDSRMFVVALDLIERCKTVEVSGSLSSKLVDEQLLEYTSSVGGVLATNDRELKEQASKLGIPVLILRGKKQLKLKGSIF